MPSYPNPTPSPAPGYYQPPAREVNALEFLSRGWLVVKSNFGTAIGGSLLVMLMTGLIAGMLAVILFYSILPELQQLFEEMMGQIQTGGAANPTAFQTYMEGWMLEFYALIGMRTLAMILLITIFTAPLDAGFVYLMLKRGRGEQAPVGTIFAAYGRFVDLAVGALIFFVVQAGPAFVVQYLDPLGQQPILGLVTTIWSWFFWVALVVWSLLILDQKKSGLQSIPVAWKMTQGYRLRIFVAFLLYSIIVGLIAVIAIFVLAILIGGAAAANSAAAAVVVGMIAMIVALGVMLVMQAWYYGIVAAIYDYALREHAARNAEWYDPTAYDGEVDPMATPLGGPSPYAMPIPSGYPDPYGQPQPGSYGHVPPPGYPPPPPAGHYPPQPGPYGHVPPPGYPPPPAGHYPPPPTPPDAPPSPPERPRE